MIPGLGRSPEEGKGYLLQYSGLENPMDCVAHGVAKSRTQLSNFKKEEERKTNHEQVGLLELCWWLTGEEPACQRRKDEFVYWVGKIPWRRAWQPTPVFLPGESHGQRSLAGYSPQGRRESDMRECLTHTHTRRPR